MTKQQQDAYINILHKYLWDSSAVGSNREHRSACVFTMFIENIVVIQCYYNDVKKYMKIKSGCNPPRNTNVISTLPTGLGQADMTFEIPWPLATETWVRHKRASKKNQKTVVLLWDLWKENRFRVPTKRKRPQSILSALLLFTWSVTDYGLYLPIT